MAQVKNDPDLEVQEPKGKGPQTISEVGKPPKGYFRFVNRQTYGQMVKLSYKDIHEDDMSAADPAIPEIKPIKFLDIYRKKLKKNIGKTTGWIAEIAG